MNNLAREVLARLPLAEAILTAWQGMADETFLEDLFQKHRGRCYTQEVRFPTLVRLIHDVLIGLPTASTNGSGKPQRRANSPRMDRRLTRNSAASHWT